MLERTGLARAVLILAILSVATAGRTTPGKKAKSKSNPDSAFKDVTKLAAKLEGCQPFSQKFKHPMTGEMLMRRVSGMVDGKCHYVEEMPNGGKLECRYDEQTRKAVAKFYRMGARAKTMKTSVRISSSGKTEQSNEYDGKKLEDPMSKAMADGTCLIQGY